ncbi:MAG: hypothetical protein COU47_03275 [Candidatus Niyogibacteria bacterium CG10_big_fil_rev_8_21_14_0_10_46_36]|uniref:Uncharacterized protein n=1 Tax=Candidatus Niyogibacteria bacterium CG10_big_fil_rev_8_21_14_0_10_46_36 TaxID=1974726 RepID=A0A2H0TEX3_9BACT|nr:MAG: hypothetical protein COU47_03275 [Candidatus Niyogibacteria bacterium CG10_big_fil_rev_8_21_14_0_10_46_36]
MHKPGIRPVLFLYVVLYDGYAYMFSQLIAQIHAGITPDVMGWFVTAITITYSVIGLPAQIYKNWKRKSLEGFSNILCVLVFFTFWGWFLYGIIQSDNYIIIANAPGAVAVTVLLFQMFLYRKNPVRISAGTSAKNTL